MSHTQFHHWEYSFSQAEPFCVDGHPLPGFISRVLAARGVRDSAAAAHFLHCDEPLHDPMLLADMDKAAALLHGAIEQQKKLLIFGDYDCDGITATVMLYDYLENAGADVCYYIPERLTEGYGLSRRAVDMVKEAGIDLIVTVDNGISSIEEAEYARSLGITLIITDHHTLSGALPAADAVVNPNRPDSEYPCRSLCGAGVAFKLICALEQSFQSGDDAQELLLEQYGDLLVLGTLADVVPLEGENRTLVRRGLAALAGTVRPGLLALAEAAKIDLSACTSETVSFILAPRINVTGRIGSVDTAVALLLSADEEQAAELAQEMNAMNARRREIEEGIASEIRGQISAKPALLHRRLLTVAGDDWHPGVIGITASRLVERFRKPCIIISCQDGTARGSCRSVEGFSIIEALTACGGLLEKFGGHPMAAGFTLKEENIPKLIEALERYAEEYYPVMPRYTLHIDAPVEAQELTLPNVQALCELSPFGCANPQPVFLLAQAELHGITPIGNGQHLRLNVSCGGANIQPVYFGVGAEQFPFTVGELLDIACTLSINTYNEQERVSVRVVNIHPCGYQAQERSADEAAFEALMRGEASTEALPEFTREDMATVFRFLREHAPYHAGVDALFHEISRSRPGTRYFTVLSALQVLLELGLIAISGEDVISVLPSQQKANLEDSPTFCRLQADR